MGKVDDVAQKIKGKAQQIKGELEENSGDEIHGFWEKTKGKANETIADIKLKTHDHK